MQFFERKVNSISKIMLAYSESFEKNASTASNYKVRFPHSTAPTPAIPIPGSVIDDSMVYETTVDGIQITLTIEHTEPVIENPTYIKTADGTIQVNMDASGIPYNSKVMLQGSSQNKHVILNTQVGVTGLFTSGTTIDMLYGGNIQIESTYSTINVQGYVPTGYIGFIDNMNNVINFNGGIQYIISDGMDYTLNIPSSSNATVLNYEPRVTLNFGSGDDIVKNEASNFYVDGGQGTNYYYALNDYDELSNVSSVTLKNMHIIMTKDKYINISGDVLYSANNDVITIVENGVTKTYDSYGNRLT